MDFEYDPKKSESNIKKHGIDFKEGQKLWRDPNGLVFRVEVEGETRYALLAKCKSKNWSAIFTIRAAKTRIISIRRLFYMKTEKFDQLFDAGKSDIIENLDLGSASRPGLETKRVNVDFPNWVVDQLDLQATKLGVPRQSLIKIWIADRLKQEKLA